MPNDTHGHHKPEIWSQKCQEFRHPEASEPAHTQNGEYQQNKNQTAKPNKPASQLEYCQATRPATMKPATAKGAGGRGEALR
jgi:hypothetical protein